MKKFAFLSLLSIFGSFAFADNLFLNSEFDSPTLQAGTAPRIPGGSDLIPNWTVLGPSVLHIHFQYAEPGNGIAAFNAAAGVAFVDLTGASNEGLDCGVSQMVPTTIGTSYEILFRLGVCRASNGSQAYQTASVLDISIDGGARTSYTNSQDMPVGQVIWLPFYHRFTAKSATTNVAFLNGTSLSTNNCVGLDSVCMYAVPEPSTWATLGMASLILLRKKRSV
jgi:hypothetical protein